MFVRVQNKEKPPVTCNSCVVTTGENQPAEVNRVSVNPAFAVTCRLGLGQASLKRYRNALTGNQQHNICSGKYLSSELYTCTL